MRYEQIENKLVDNFSAREKLINIENSTDIRPGNLIESKLYGDVFPVEDNSGNVIMYVRGWSLIKPNGSIVSTGYYAQVHKVEYIVDGEVYDTRWVSKGTELTSIDAPEKFGYKFLQWVDLPLTMGEEDVTATALYKQIEFVIYIYIDGILKTTDICEVGTDIQRYINNVLSIDTTGLYMIDDIPEVMPEHNIEIKYITSNESYTVSFYNTE